MKLPSLFGRKNKRVVLIVQCRLSSTRLPRKALLPLGGRPVLEWVLLAMRRVEASRYYLAVDTASAEELEPVARRCHYEFFAGSRDDVLDRFCRVIELSKADVVVRATADNPFLFYEAAQDMVHLFEAEGEVQQIDYLTFTGLPHGSGVEMFNARSLLRAATMTTIPFDHEHVGPALYNHQEHFNCQFVKAPRRYAHPELRTTIDTPFDYRQAQALVRAVSGGKAPAEPYTAEQVFAGLRNDAVRNPLLLVPSTMEGRGTGHLRRCLDIAVKSGADVYVPKDASLEQAEALVQEARTRGLADYQVVRSLESAGSYALALLDMFQTPPQLLRELGGKCPIAAVDEGAPVTDGIDYLLDVIPAVGLERKANLAEPGFIALPEKVRTNVERGAQIHTALVAMGGEDPAALLFPAMAALADLGLYVTAIAADEARVAQLCARVSERLAPYVKVVGPVQDLKEHLREYDLVVTHYGFTAFEAAAAGCAVILLGTTTLHERLAATYGFTCLAPEKISPDAFRDLLAEPKVLLHEVPTGAHQKIEDFAVALSRGKRILCPVCRAETAERDVLVARTAERTFRRCRICGMLYMSWTMQARQTDYGRAYFYDDYEKQYGKTYEEDFESIKAQGVRRVGVMDLLYRKKHSSVTPSVLDVGCALGPFLDAANDAGWQVFGVDVSPDAIRYVQDELHFPALRGSFPAVDVSAGFGMDSFDAVTMWYVIEHFQNLDEVLRAVSRIVKAGGIFAFSTPSASGVSGRYSTQSFFEQSPADHYTLWEPGRADSILRRYGFQVEKIVSTGIHPERFPQARRHGWKEKSIQFSVLRSMSRLLTLGDTFEVYCRKVR